MKREIKFRIVYKNTESGKIRIIPITLGQHIPHLGVEWQIITEAQYTGLKDKNGKEFYPGDVCKAIEERHKRDWPEYSDNLEQSKEVRFVIEDSESYFTFRAFSSDKYYAYHNIKSPEYHRYNYPDRIGTEAYFDHSDFGKRDYIKYIDFEVIGNIYENPELLTVAK